MNLTKLNRKKARRLLSLRAHRKKAQAQRKKWRKTKKRGYLKAAKKNSQQAKRDAAAIRKINRLIELASRPSPNFRYSEFDCHNGQQVPKAAYSALDHLCRNYLEPLRDEFGPVGVTSGYRPVAYNASIGGATSSVHIYDLADGRNFRMVAADVYCARGNPGQWGAFLSDLHPGGLGIYPGSGFVHVDNRQLAGWPQSRWTG
jgi:uncharacterized protein YcbK (DUF882 family)